MLVDATVNTGSSDHKMFYGRGDIGAGSPFPAYGENDRVGFYWDNLTETGIAFSRMIDDAYAQTINARIWTWPAAVYLPVVRK